MPFRLRYLFIVIGFFWISSFAAWANLSRDSLYLTWKQSPTTTMVAQWITPTGETEATIYYRAINETQWQKKTGFFHHFPQNPPFLIARVELNHLTPDTLYVFRQNECSKLYRFRTLPARLDTSVRFVVGGDMYHDGLELLTETSKQAAKFNPLFAVLGGDIAYTCHVNGKTPQKVNRWIEWIKNWHANMVTDDGRLIPVISAVGNHDVYGEFDQTPAEAVIFGLLFPMPGTNIYNVIDIGDYLSLFLLDSGHANPVKGRQSEWLKKALKNRQDVPNKFAVYHVPAYTSARSFNNRRSLEIRKHWVPIFEEGGIQTAFEHHDHAYKRTYPLLRNKINPKGIVYIGDGAWGVEKTRQARRNYFYLEKFISTRNFVGVILNEDSQTFMAIDPQGKTIDTCVRKKEPEKQTEF